MKYILDGSFFPSYTFKRTFFWVFDIDFNYFIIHLFTTIFFYHKKTWYTISWYTISWQKTWYTISWQKLIGNFIIKLNGYFDNYANCQV